MTTITDDATHAVVKWLPPLVLLKDYGGEWTAYEDALYEFFKADFVDSTPSYPGRRWAVKRHPLIKGKEATFWHIISSGKVESERLPDLRRCERIRWPRPMIDACNDGSLRYWEQLRRNKAGAQEKRIAIATADFSYVVILADRTEFILLWTAFYVEYAHQRRKLQKEYDSWVRSRGR